MSGDRGEAEALRTQLAPDITLPEMEPGDEIVAFATRPPFDLERALARPGPVIYVEAPRRLGNLGAAIRPPC